MNRGCIPLVEDPIDVRLALGSLASVEVSGNVPRLDYRHVLRQHGVYAVPYIKERQFRRAKEVHAELQGMHARVRPRGACYAHVFADNLFDCLFERSLQRSLIRLQLPPGKVRAVELE